MAGWAGRKAALLIGAALPGFREDDGIVNDNTGMDDALRARGWNDSEIRRIYGRPLDPDALRAFLQETGRLLAAKRTERLFLHYSGHGYRSSPPRPDDTVAMALAEAARTDPRYRMTYTQLFDLLPLPPFTRVTLLHDG